VEILTSLVSLLSMVSMWTLSFVTKTDFICLT
jgi:hypothetical protein